MTLSSLIEEALRSHPAKYSFAKPTHGTVVRIPPATWLKRLKRLQPPDKSLEGLPPHRAFEHILATWIQKASETPECSSGSGERFPKRLQLNKKSPTQPPSKETAAVIQSLAEGLPYESSGELVVLASPRTFPAYLFTTAALVAGSSVCFLQSLQGDYPPPGAECHFIADKPFETPSQSDNLKTAYFMKSSTPGRPGLSYLADRRFGVSHLEHPEAPRSNSVGRPLPGYSCKTKNTKAEETGEVLIRPPYSAPTYTREANQGWIATNDSGYLKSGFLYLTDEKSNGN